MNAHYAHRKIVRVYSKLNDEPTWRPFSVLSSSTSSSIEHSQLPVRSGSNLRAFPGHYGLIRRPAVVLLLAGGKLGFPALERMLAS